MTVYIIKKKNNWDIKHIFSNKERAIDYIRTQLEEKGNSYFNSSFWVPNRNKLTNKDILTLEDMHKILCNAYHVYCDLKRKLKQSTITIQEIHNNKDYDTFYGMYRKGYSYWGRDLKEAIGIFNDVVNGKQSIFKTKFLDEYLFPYEME